METSAKNSINVDKAFISLAKDIKVRIDNEGNPNRGGDTENNNSNVVNVGPGGGGTENKGGCAC